MSISYFRNKPLILLAQFIEERMYVIYSLKTEKTTGTEGTSSFSAKEES
jgi:hypothetical protein